MPVIVLTIRYCIIFAMLSLLVNLAAQWIGYYAYFEANKWAKGTTQRAKWNKIEYVADLISWITEKVTIVFGCLCFVVTIIGIIVSFI